MRKYDLVVCGGGIAGVAAAVQARRSGVNKVLLIERRGFLGGGAAAETVGAPSVPSCGFMAEMLEEMQQLGGMKNNGAAPDGECLKLVLQRLCTENGVELLLHTVIEQVHVKGDRLVAVRTANRSGIEFMAADAFIDCTGDADTAHLCGVPWKKGREEDGLCRPVAVSFRMGGVDREKMPPIEEVNRLCAAAMQEDSSAPRAPVTETAREDILQFNTVRIAVQDPLSARSMTDAELMAREQVWETAQFLIRNVAGFENAYLLSDEVRLRVQDSRRIVGEYTLTAEDLADQTRFPDAVCRLYAPEKGFYEIPYRVMVPVRISNLLVAGRSASADYAAQPVLCGMTAGAAMGQAAGLAASIVLRKGGLFKDLNGLKLHNRLRDLGAIREDI